MTGHMGIPQIQGDLDPQEQLLYDLYLVKRWTQHKVAAHLGVSQQRVSQMIAVLRAKLPPVDIAAMRAASIAMYGDIARRAYELAEMNGAPVTAGKDGSVVYDPEGGGVVRDYAGRVAALKLAALADAELRKLIGLDAAQKVESTATVRYEIAGIEPEALK